MSGGYVDIDMSEFKAFFNRLDRAAKGEFRKELVLFLEEIGNEFLQILQGEIVRRQITDSGQLLASFEKGADGSIWELKEGGLTLEVGTSLNYAAYVNDGHWTNPGGVEMCFVPGYWDNDRFIYDPSAEGGMILKQHWVEGTHYWESALRILNQIYPEILEAKLQEWITRYF